MAGVEGRPDWLIQNVFFQLSERTLMERFSFGWWFGTFYFFPYIGNNNPN